MTTGTRLRLSVGLGMNRDVTVKFKLTRSRRPGSLHTPGLTRDCGMTAAAGRTVAAATVNAASRSELPVTNGGGLSPLAPRPFKCPSPWHHQ